ncbi:Histone methylation protein DOT1 family protein [Cryptosporidium felis]|nr:Histone methylation protein DOT1 family protein [Cryptosporidium felis]
MSEIETERETNRITYTPCNLKLGSGLEDRDTQEIRRYCCGKMKCNCTSFLWRGVNVDLGTSDEGMYGETREKSLRSIFSKMTRYGLDKHSILLDIGSGRGVPNIVASHQSELFSSIGIELDEKAFFLSLSNHLNILEGRRKPPMENISKENLSKNVFTSSVDERINSIHLGFSKGDATLLESFEPVTHIYSFDAAMPIWMIKKFVDLFNSSKTTYCYVSYRKDLIEALDLKGTKMHGISTQMMGSGEGRMCWLYVKSSWKEIKNHCDEYILNNYSKNNVENINFDLTTLTNIDEIVKFSICDDSTQIKIINSTLSFWYNNRRSRKECKNERSIMNQRHKELKQAYANERINRDSTNQLTLEEVGIKMKLNIKSNDKSNKIDRNKTSELVQSSSKIRSKKSSDEKQLDKEIIDQAATAHSSISKSTLKIVDPGINQVKSKGKTKGDVSKSKKNNI